ncbi:MAG: zinc ribbon domain-containing protein [Deltaproteobacteria bacterium]|nr:zinc ribbon domain-containing protein [Deltaproteobacteria bacterium]
MPIFEFVCEECGKQFERIFFISECDSPVTCPSCGSEHTKKSFSVFSHTGIEKSLSSSCGSSGAKGFS